MVFGALTIDFSPVVWLIPAVIALTFIHNTFILLVASAESYHSPRLYSPTPVSIAYFLTFLWTTSLAASIAITSLLFANAIRTTDEKIKIWVVVIAGVSLLETILLGFIAIMSHREMKHIRYKNKWRWRVDITGGHPSQWRLVGVVFIHALRKLIYMIIVLQNHNHSYENVNAIFDSPCTNPMLSPPSFRHSFELCAVLTQFHSFSYLLLPYATLSIRNTEKFICSAEPPNAKELNFQLCIMLIQDLQVTPYFYNASNQCSNFAPGFP
jgi:hypothetical protein